ncbi:death-associated protein kinase 2-like [Brienomyrus brachyistius]|uniref:death-associated protein kinase 2-like n=1 Tax=Brienomyrus brachyistius TaxID=42636 RepID=UPI0020B3F887|nr:death-associated protein kinase 2-like [Brienomyrus brachyistius]XP_048857154.1 death-associated protein kinase 2-like [Brienomyrus brachyistius]
MSVFRLENVEDFYEIGKVIGSGNFGQVRDVRDRSSGTHWAGKFLKVKNDSGPGLDRRRVEEEVGILQALQHENIMALWDVFEGAGELVLIMELITGGELFDFIAEKEHLLESEAIVFIKQILQGVKYMHSKQIVHFDLKPENIMLSDKKVPFPQIKIIDFGLAQYLTPGVGYRSSCGTPQYIAPEVIRYEPLSSATDMWSIGVITYILLSGMSPFQGDTDEETLKNIVTMNYEIEDRYFPDTSENAKEFIKNLLVNDQSGRMTTEECLQHPWIKPLSRAQQKIRKRSSINMKNFKKFNAKRKWKLSYNMVLICYRLNQLHSLRQKAAQGYWEQKADSDQEEALAKPVSLNLQRCNSR